MTRINPKVKDSILSQAQEIYKEAYSGALEKYGEEDRAHKASWLAVKEKYRKDRNGNWVKKK